MSQSGSEYSYTLDDVQFGCYRSYGNDCEMCDKMKDEQYKLVAHNRSVKTAHILAMKESYATMDRRFDFLDLYTAMFRKIYEHEYVRNSYVEYERMNHNLYLDAIRNKKELCSYHGEIDEATTIEVHREVEREYSRCKYPKPLPSGRSKR